MSDTRKYFGTDGIRGQANAGFMTAEVAMRLGRAAGNYFLRGEHRHRVVIGKDTRLSGYMIEPALTAGFISAGMDVILIGPLPTPGIAMLARSMRADLGVMISASHNPYKDNGIKLFGPDGYKLSDAQELEIERAMDEDQSSMHASSAKLGRARRPENAGERYVEFAKGTFPKRHRLDGLKIVLDCAHGAAYKVAPLVLWELGAEVVTIGVSPDGFNINDGCGSTEPNAMCAKVREVGADIGIALDGDADRVLIADEKGRLIDGDQIMGLIGLHLHRRGTLRGGGIVSTVMSNLGLERHLDEQGLKLIRTKVGDRYVVEHMRQHGFNVGGEQSGHMVLNDFTTTGDGLIAALQVLAVVCETGKPVSEVCHLFDPLPQLLRNVRYSVGSTPLDEPSVKKAISNGEEELNGKGRVLIRKSGTEPVIRVMAEGENSDAITKVVDRIVDAIEAIQ